MRYIVTVAPHGAYISEYENDTTKLINSGFTQELIPMLKELNTTEIYVFKSSMSLGVAETISNAGFEIRFMEEE